MHPSRSSCGPGRPSDGRTGPHRIRPPWAALWVFLPLALLPGCFLLHQTDPFAPGVTVLIQNATSFPAEISVVRGRHPQRIGRIPPGAVQEFRLPWGSGNLAIQAEFPTSRRPVRQSLSARSGEFHRYRLEATRFLRMGE